MKRVFITGTGLFTPTESISNDELVAAFNAYVTMENPKRIERGEEPLAESNAEFIVKASGIRNRYVMDKAGILDPSRMAPSLPQRPQDEHSLQCEMSVAAAKGALAQAGLEASDIDCVVVACSNMQRAYPAIAVEVQAALGTSGYAYDMNVACSSATFGIQNATDAIRSGSARRVLMLNPEICSGHLDFRDRDCHFIFGDVCTAVILEGEDDAGEKPSWEVLATSLHTQFSSNIRNDAGFLDRHDGSAPSDRNKLFHQQGRRVFKDVCPMVANIIKAHLEAEKIEVTSVRRFWLHQANLSMNLLIAKRVLGREPTDDESPTVLDEYANTSSAGSIIAFHKHSEDLAQGEIGVLCSFGAGYSVGSVILRRT
ncbi:MAG: beta-ketoacyl-ACP synthase III [Polyangiales bacterium]